MEAKALFITSPAFEPGAQIPARFTCDDEEVSPELHIEGIPEGTVTLALKVEDPDAPGGTFYHWLVWNIAPAAVIAEGANPGISGKNSAGKTGYHGPCPPDGAHRYYFYVFALDTSLDLPAGSGKEELNRALTDHIIAQGSIMGYYQKNS